MIKLGNKNSGPVTEFLCSRLTDGHSVFGNGAQPRTKIREGSHKRRPSRPYRSQICSEPLRVISGDRAIYERVRVVCRRIEPKNERRDAADGVKQFSRCVEHNRENI